MVRLSLAGIDIAIEVFSLVANDNEIEALRADLAAEDLARLVRLAPATRRRRALVARARLRRHLAACLDCAPQAVPLAYGEHGKPRLAAPGSHAIRFNLAHCGDVAVLATGADAEIGIDIEALRELDPAVGHAILSLAEQTALTAIGADERSARLLARWTMKEAALKAVGCGFQRPPAALDFGDLRTAAAVSADATALGHRGTVAVRSLPDLHPDHVAALAVLRDEAAP
jgi:4'-phosphopantetheinyl transferase